MVALLDETGARREGDRYFAYGMPFGLPRADCDADGDVDAADATIISTASGNSVGDPGYDVRADLDLDGLPSGSPLPDVRTHYVYDAGWQLLEERIDEGYDPLVWNVFDESFGTLTHVNQYFWDPTGSDELRFFQSLDLETPAATHFWALQDRDGNVLSLDPDVISSNRPIPVRTRYTPYGLAQQTPTADLDGNGRVNVVDAWVTAWGTSPGDGAYDPYADHDLDGVVTALDFGDYATLIGTSIPRGNPWSNGCIIGFAGACYDDAAGLWLMRNRWMDSKLGRFLNRDPADYAGGGNLFEYGHSNPLSYSDPLGLWCLSEDGMAIAQEGDTASALAMLLLGDMTRFEGLGFEDDPASLPDGYGVDLVEAWVVAHASALETGIRSESLAVSVAREVGGPLPATPLSQKVELALHAGGAGTSAGAAILASALAKKVSPLLLEQLTSRGKVRAYRKPFTTKGTTTPWEAAQGEKAPVSLSGKLLRGFEILDRVAVAAGVVMETTLAAESLYEGRYEEATVHGGFAVSIVGIPASGPYAPFTAGVVAVAGIADYEYHRYLNRWVATHEFENNDLSLRMLAHRENDLRARMNEFVRERNAIEAVLGGASSLTPCPCDIEP